MLSIGLEKNPYYSDVALDPARLTGIVDGAEIPGVKDMDASTDRLPEDMGPAPDQVAPVGEGCEASFETGGMLLPEITPDIKTEVGKLIESSRQQGESGEKHVVSPCPSVDPNPAPEYRARGFFCMASPGYSVAA